MDLIIGAGITGLSYASFSKNDYMIIEKENEIGGYCRTIKQDGFTWDYAGHFFHFQNPNIKNFVIKNIPPKDLLTINKQTQIKYHDRLIDYPFQQNIHQLSKYEFIDCLYDLFNTKDTEYTSFKQMLYCKYGKSIAEKFLVPYNEKLYACDLNELDQNAMGRFFPKINKEDIILNFKERNNQSYNSTFLYPKEGAFEYVKSVYQYLNGDKIYLNESIKEIDIKRHIAYTNQRKIKYTNLISTIPFPELLKVCQIEYDSQLYISNKVLVFNIGFDKKGMDRINHWIYFPEEKYPFYRIGFYDNILSSDRLSVYVEISLKNHSSINIDSLFEKTLNGMRDAGIITDHKVISSKVLIMDPAYVLLSRRMQEERDKIMKELKSKNIYSIGRYGNWTYSSIEDNIKQAKELSINL